MANKKDGSSHKSVNKGAWSAEEDRILAQHIERHGPRRWKYVAIQSGLNRCGKSCRLRWLNYLRPDIKRGNICDAEEDLILRLHRLLGNRWSLIARRLPGRTDNEIKNHWNAHLRKKAKLVEKLPAFSTMVQSNWEEEDDDDDDDEGSNSCVREDVPMSSGGDDQELTSHHHHHQFFDFSPEGGRTHGLEWVKSFLELEEDF